MQLAGAVGEEYADMQPAHLRKHRTHARTRLHGQRLHPGALARQEGAPEKFERMLKRSLCDVKSSHVSYQEENEAGEPVQGGSNGFVWTFTVRNFNRENASEDAG